MACKPGSVPPAEADATIIPLDRPLLDGSRDLPGRLGPVKPCLAFPFENQGATSQFGLAPSGACRAVPVARSAVGSYPTLSPLPTPKRRRFAFCGAIPRVTPGGRYPPPFHRGARTFLDPCFQGPRSPGRLIRRTDEASRLRGQGLDVSKFRRAADGRGARESHRRQCHQSVRAANGAGRP